MKDSPCFGCRNRNETCHGACVAYAQFSATREKARAWNFTRKGKEHELCAYESRNVERSRRSRRKR